MLVVYNRPDSAGAKLCEYQCISVIHPDDLKVSFRVFIMPSQEFHVTYNLPLQLVSAAEDSIAMLFILSRKLVNHSFVILILM